VNNYRNIYKIEAQHHLRESKIKRRSFLKKTISLIGATVIATYIGAGIGCRSPNGPEPPQPPTKVTQTGRITDIFNSQPLAGLTITGADNQVTTNSNGDYSFTYTKGTAPALIMTLAGYVTRTTFPAHGPDYHNIPDSFNMSEFNKICRNEGPTHRWSTDPAKKPTVYITSKDGSAVPSQLKNIIHTVVSTYFPQITNNTFTGLSIVEELDYSKVPTSNAFVFVYIKNGVGDSELDNQNNNIIYYTRIDLGGSNADGSEHIFGAEVMHEAGHGIGFTGHASTQNSIMWQGGGKPDAPTALDIQNGTVLYDRPAGNSAPDNDPSAVASSGMAGTYEWTVQSTNDNPSILDPFGLTQENPNIYNDRRMPNEKQREGEVQRNPRIREKH
jgi:hypothetical protein